MIQESYVARLFIQLLSRSQHGALEVLDALHFAAACKEITLVLQ